MKGGLPANVSPVSRDVTGTFCFQRQILTLTNAPGKRDVLIAALALLRRESGFHNVRLNSSGQAMASFQVEETKI
jgi:hypothetical protein